MANATCRATGPRPSSTSSCRPPSPNRSIPMSKTIMLIHGAWLNSKSWEGVKARYEAQGFSVIAPDWPYDDRDPAQLRESPRPELARIGQREILAHYEEL